MTQAIRAGAIHERDGGVEGDATAEADGVLVSHALHIELDVFVVELDHQLEPAADGCP